MFGYLLTTVFTGTFIYIDSLLGNIKGKYYINHVINNFIIILLSIGDVMELYSNPYLAFNYSYYSIYTSSLTYSLHLYHIIWYFNKLRFDDYLHHGLMIFVCLPIANYFGPNKLLNHSMFYLTGLPGGVDYLLLSLVRNNYIDRLTEKKINRYLNIWIRCPGTIIHMYITLLNLPYLYQTNQKILGLLTGFIVYWNGVYFMDKVVGNLYMEINKKIENLNI